MHQLSICSPFKSFPIDILNGKKKRKILFVSENKLAFCSDLNRSVVKRSRSVLWKETFSRNFLFYDHFIS
jgi:hypothetical protein